jgi:hypothetical protein
MQNKKMTNPTDGINESNKKLRSIYDQLCCMTSAIKEIDINVGDIELEVDGVEELLQDILDALNASGGPYNAMQSSSLAAAGTLTFSPGNVHSFSWELGAGASIQIGTGTSTNTFSSSGSISFSTLNTQTLTLTAVGGTVKIIYIY